MLVEALVLDRDHGLLHDRRDLVRGEQDAALVVGQGRDLVAVDVVDDGVPRLLVLLARLQRRKILCDGHHDPEDPGDEGQRGEAEQDEGEAQLAQPRLAATVGLRRAGRLRQLEPAPASAAAVAA
jgi:hypothetical protein